MDEFWTASPRGPRQAALPPRRSRSTRATIRRPRGFPPSKCNRIGWDRFYFEKLCLGKYFFRPTKSATSKKLEPLRAKTVISRLPANSPQRAARFAHATTAELAMVLSIGGAQQRFRGKHKRQLRRIFRKVRTAGWSSCFPRHSTWECASETTCRQF